MSTQILVAPSLGRVRQMALWNHPGKEKRLCALSFLLSLVFHGFVLMVSGFAFVQAPEYGIRSNQGGVEINLVAAVPEAPPVPQPQIEIAKSEMERALPEPEKIKVEKPKTGTSAVNFSSRGDGETDEKAGYLKNPAPPYPAEALEKGQEGMVLLAVKVDRFGNPRQVKVQESSGYRLLNDAAVKAVEKWKFSPARIGALTTETDILIPIRFRLADALKSRAR